MQIWSLTSERLAARDRGQEALTNTKPFICELWASSAMPTACQGPSACHPRPHLTLALRWLHLPQKSQGSSLGEQRTHENSPKPSAGCRPCRGSKEASGGSVQTHLNPSPACS